MQALITGLLVAFVALVTRGHAQQPAPRFWVAPFGTASLNNWPTPSHERLGVRVALPFLDRLTFYPAVEIEPEIEERDRKSTRLNSSHLGISYAVFCLKKKKKKHYKHSQTT